jgi:hypothetical protein
VEYECFGAVRHAELKPGGSHINVTTANRAEYIQLYTRWLLDTSIKEQFSAFSSGFHQVWHQPVLQQRRPQAARQGRMLCGTCGGPRRHAQCGAWHLPTPNPPQRIPDNVRAPLLRACKVCGGPALSLLRSEELELLLAGLPHLDFAALERGTRYEGGYSSSSVTVRAFWQVVGRLHMDAKRRLLAFITGCDRAPVAGLGALTLTIQRAGADSERLPSAHTCFNVLLLPDYEAVDKLQAKLLLAIENGQGFGLR